MIYDNYTLSMSLSIYTFDKRAAEHANRSNDRNVVTLCNAIVFVVHFACAIRRRYLYKKYIHFISDTTIAQLERAKMAKRTILFRTLVKRTFVNSVFARMRENTIRPLRISKNILRRWSKGRFVAFAF